MTSLFAHARARAPRGTSGQPPRRPIAAHRRATRVRATSARAREDRARRIDALERRVTSNETRAERRRGKIPLTREEDVFEI